MNYPRVSTHLRKIHVEVVVISTTTVNRLNPDIKDRKSIGDPEDAEERDIHDESHFVQHTQYDDLRVPGPSLDHNNYLLLQNTVNRSPAGRDVWDD